MARVSYKEPGLKAIWKYNKRSGLWDFQRDVTDENHQEWLKIFRDDEPGETFKIAKYKPKGDPMKKNPAKRPTPAQLAARKAFAAAAKAGTLQKGKPIKRNPAKKTVNAARESSKSYGSALPWGVYEMPNGALLGKFPSQAAAIFYAQSWSDKNKRQTMISTSTPK